MRRTEVRDESGGELIDIIVDGPVRRITMTRAAKRNALSRALVAALHHAIAEVREGDGTRVVVLAGDGPVFCAGADIAEFVEAAEGGSAVADGEGIVDLLAAIATCPAPVVARVHGAVFGGAVGLVAACDLAIAAEGTRFSLSEARLGLVAAVIAPYVFAALGPREAKARILLASPFDAVEALRIGLVHRVVPADGLDGALDATIGELLMGAPGALAAIKRLPGMLEGRDPAAARVVTTALLAERLVSDEGQEGLRAFLERRRPAWAPTDAS
jgi:methylglutaconyl-CoA hydratase